MLSVGPPSRQTVAEPVNVPVGVMSTILVEPKILNGVEAGAAGLDATGTTVTEVGTVPPKFKVIAGSAAVAGITAALMLEENVATCEFGTDPTVIAATGSAAANGEKLVVTPQTWPLA